MIFQVEELFEKYKNEKKVPVAGVIIEPIQAEGGDNHASPEFFQELQRVTRKVSSQGDYIMKKTYCNLALKYFSTEPRYLSTKCKPVADQRERCGATSTSI